MTADAIVLLVIGIGAGITLIVLFMFDVIPINRRTPGSYKGPRISRTKILSTKYGEDMVIGGSTRYGKTITHLQNTGRVQDIIPYENCFPFHERSHLFGDLVIWVHIDDEYSNGTVRAMLVAGISAAQKRRMTQLIARNRTLELENEKLRRNAKEVLTEIAQTIGTMQRSTQVYNPRKSKDKDDDD